MSRKEFPTDRHALAIAALGVSLGVGATALVTAVASPTPSKPAHAAKPGEIGYDCRTQGERTCGSDVTWQPPGAYPGPDGKDYTVYEVSPYSACVAAANVPGPSGYATEVCEPLKPGWVEPVSVRPADFTKRSDHCLVFTYEQIHGPGTQAQWGDPGDGEVYCAR